jgi:hypothetical protein
VPSHRSQRQSAVDGRITARSALRAVSEKATRGAAAAAAAAAAVSLRAPASFSFSAFAAEEPGGAASPSATAG